MLPRTVAIGETGIDLHWKRDPLEVQEAWFVAQIRLARAVKKPLIIHSRLAGERCLELLQLHGAEEVGGVFHCYAEDAAFAQRLKSINFLVSFTGVITFKKADAVREIVRDIPIDQIMVETDGPYMAPEPHRGKRCEPAFVVNTLATLAQIKGIPAADAAAITTANAQRLFRLSADAS
jgi:TatD DNase family protein